ncbi:MAG: sulfotransferase family 2 domain-containing protein [Verrucomicrobiota bacterium]
MLVSEKYKLIFIAVPKTGTSSFNVMFEELLNAERNKYSIGSECIACPEHIDYKTLRSVVGDQGMSQFLIVGATRNPWDRMVSAYSFYNSGRVVGRVSAGKQLGFKAIINVVLAKILPFRFWIRIKPYRSCMSYLRDESGQMRADYVIRFEEYTHDLKSLCRRLGVEFKAPVHINKSDRKCYRDYYTDSTRRLVGKRFRDDIEMFKYEF